MTSTQRFITLGIVALAFVLRLITLTYGVDDVCLAPPQEAWLYGDLDVLALWTLPETPLTLLERTLEAAPSTRHWLRADSTLIAVRLLGGALGSVVVLLTLLIAYQRKSNAWWLAGLLVAVAPPFVMADRWVQLYDLAPALVAMMVFALHTSHIYPDSTRWQWLAMMAGGALALLSPPLWWLVLLMMAWMPRPRAWQAFWGVLAVAFVMLPLVRSPLHWANALAYWDDALQASLLWAGLLAGVWSWRVFARWVQVAGATAIGLLLLVTLSQTVSLPRPTDAERALVRLAQDVLPDNAIVHYAREVWHLREVVACPMGADVRVTAPATLPPAFGFNQDPRPMPSPDYIIRKANPEDDVRMPIYFRTSEYVIERENSLATPINALFGDQLRLLSYHVELDALVRGYALPLRLMFQYAPQANVETTAYGYYIHLIVPDQPAEKVASLDINLLDSLGTIAPRTVVNVRVFVPMLPNVTAGTYEIRMGVVNQYTGEALRVGDKDYLTLGEVEIFDD